MRVDQNNISCYNKKNPQISVTYHNRSSQSHKIQWRRGAAGRVTTLHSHSGTQREGECNKQRRQGCITQQIKIQESQLNASFKQTVSNFLIYKYFPCNIQIILILKNYPLFTHNSNLTGCPLFYPAALTHGFRSFHECQCPANR